MDMMVLWVDLIWLPDPVTLALPFLSRVGREKKTDTLLPTTGLLAFRERG